MQNLHTITIALSLTLLTACAATPPGNNSITEGRVSVTYGERVLKNVERIEVLKELNAAETLHEYVLRQVERSKAFSEVRVEIVITSILIRMSHFNKNVSRMDCDIVIYDGAKEMVRFKSGVHTSKKGGTAVTKMSKAVAREVYSRLKDG